MHKQGAFIHFPFPFMDRQKLFKAEVEGLAMAYFINCASAKSVAHHLSIDEDLCNEVLSKFQFAWDDIVNGDLPGEEENQACTQIVSNCADELIEFISLHK